jgi:YD repeat-containing protein
VFGNREQHQADNSGNSTIVQKWVEAGDISMANNRYTSGVSYDAAGNVTADPRFRNMLYGYDANGNLVSTKTARNATITNTYDALNRLVLKNYSDEAMPDVSYLYDHGPGSETISNAGGKLVMVSNGVSNTKFTAYEQTGELLSSQQTVDGQTYGF